MDWLYNQSLDIFWILETLNLQIRLLCFINIGLVGITVVFIPNEAVKGTVYTPKGVCGEDTILNNGG